MTREQPAADGRGLRIGFGRVDITPPLSIPYLSYMPRQTPFQGVHDPLFARAMVADNGETRLAILTVDALGLSTDVLGPGRDFVAETRARIERRAGVPTEHVLLAASHAHSTPQTTHIARLLDFPKAGAWLEGLMDQLADAVVQAHERLRPASLKGSVGTAAGIAWNRRIVGEDGKLYRLETRPDRVRREPRDEQAPVLLAESLDERSPWHGVVANFACHPVTVQVQPLVSGDYPGYACALVERELPAEACLFLQGAGGDVNPLRHTTNFEDVRIYGQILGAEVLKQAAYLSAPGLSAMSATLRAGRRVIALPTRPLPERETYAGLMASAEERLRNGASETEQQRARADVRKAREVLRLIDLGTTDVPCEIQALRLGEALIVAFPGELFCQFGLDLKVASPAPITFIAAYANGYVGYLAGRDDYALGGYETSLGPWTRLGPGATERLVAEAGLLMQEVWQG
jgi:neutral ceramidase